MDNVKNYKIIFQLKNYTSRETFWAWLDTVRKPDLISSKKFYETFPKFQIVNDKRRSLSLSVKKLCLRCIILAVQ